jgi:hypothetical protein
MPNITIPDKLLLGKKLSESAGKKRPCEVLAEAIESGELTLEEILESLDGDLSLSKQLLWFLGLEIQIQKEAPE